MYPIRVLVVDDSAFMRKMISEILTSDNRIKVIATARNGLDGLKKINLLSPDVVTLDVEMPIMNGITTLQKIMETNPLPVVMLSSHTKTGASQTLQAISIGAVDFIKKPSGSISLDINKIKEEIITKVITAAEAKVTVTKSVEEKDFKTVHKLPYNRTIVAIGTSTGGPRALQKVLTDLPANFPAPILIVQHMPPSFTKTLATRLNSLAEIEVREASDGMILQNSTAYIAPGNYHMEIQEVNMVSTIKLTQEALESGHRPSVDVLFRSVANLKEINKIAVILTGMGKDGSEGIKEIKAENISATVIAEAKESSIVYGMPAAAVRTGFVNQVVHLDDIAENITSLVRRSGRR